MSSHSSELVQAGVVSQASYDEAMIGWSGYCNSEERAPRRRRRVRHGFSIVKPADLMRGDPILDMMDKPVKRVRKSDLVKLRLHAVA